MSNGIASSEGPYQPNKPTITPINRIQFATAALRSGRFAIPHQFQYYTTTTVYDSERSLHAGCITSHRRALRQWKNNFDASARKPRSVLDQGYHRHHTAATDW
jgi:hypothetical protein